METAQGKLPSMRFGNVLNGKSVVYLGIPDVYGDMDLKLIAVLRFKVLPLLRLAR